MIAPSGVAKRDSPVQFNGSKSLVGPIGKGYLVVRSRLRITRDGGHSLLASRSVDRVDRVVPEPVPIAPQISQPVEQPAIVPEDVWNAPDDAWNTAQATSWDEDPVDEWAAAAEASQTKKRPESAKPKVAPALKPSLPTPSPSTSQSTLPGPSGVPSSEKAVGTLIAFLDKERGNGNRVTWGKAKKHLYEKQMLKGGAGKPAANAKAIFLDAKQAGLLKITQDGTESYLELLS